MTQKPLLTLDVFGVLYDLLGGVLRHLETHGYKVPRHEVDERNLFSVAGHPSVAEKSRSHVIALTRQYLSNPGTYLNLSTKPGARKAVAELSKLFKLRFITSMAPHAIHVRRQIMAAMVRDFGIEEGTFTTADKTRAIRAHHPMFVVEDSPLTAESLAKKRIHTFLVVNKATNNISRNRFLHVVQNLGDVASQLTQRYKPLEQL